MLSVVLPTHEPRPEFLAETLAALRRQTLPSSEWELIVVDNASRRPLAPDRHWQPNGRTIREPRLGLTHARRAGVATARGDFVVFVDDDNLLDEDYLDAARKLAASHPDLGAFGGRSVGDFRGAREFWHAEFLDLLAVRDLGERPLVSGLSLRDGGRDAYPAHAPIGAGMVIRREAILPWLESASATSLPDRRGDELSSGGDNDLVLTILGAGWRVGYFPSLRLTHIIPAGRLTSEYLARLNFGVQKSWVQVLARHGILPWRPIPAWSVPLRWARAWLRRRAWRGPAEFVRWRGDCGRFAGQAKFVPDSRRS